MITDNVPVIAVATQPDVFPKMISNAVEVRSRGAKVILLTEPDVSVDAALCDPQIVLPRQILYLHHLSVQLSCSTLLTM